MRNFIITAVGTFLMLLTWALAMPVSDRKADSQPVQQLANQEQTIAPPSMTPTLPEPPEIASLQRAEAEQRDDRRIAELASANAIKAGLRAVVDAYREDSRFPPYAKPLRSTDTALLEPRRYPEMPMPVKGSSGITASLVPAAYISDVQQPLPVTLMVATPQSLGPSGELVGATVSLRGPSRQVGEWTLQGQPSAGDIQVMAGAIPPEGLLSAGVGEITLVATMHFGDGSIGSALASARTYKRAATLVTVGGAYVEGPHLNIPLKFDVHEPGVYRVQANLFSKEKQMPVAHLSARFELSAEQTSGVMRAHAVTLSESGSEGPYLLTDVNIVRTPSRPGEQLSYGTTLATSWPVAGYPLGDYSDEPYTDPLAQKRLQFLESLQ